MTPDELALRAAVVAAPESDLPRLVYADWLEERGELERAEFIRVGCDRSDLSVSVTINPEDVSDWLAGRNDRHYATIIAADPNQTPPPGTFTFRLRRGFVHTVQCSAADWLEHGDRIAWRPGWTMECPQCGGVFGPKGGSPPPWPPELCLCHGSGRVPRPCPPTAQPVEVVRLTTWPDHLDGNRDHTPPHVTRGSQFEIAGQMVEAPSWLLWPSWSVPAHEWYPVLLGLRWPGIRFALLVLDSVTLDARRLHGPIAWTEEMLRDAAFSPLFTFTGQGLPGWLDDAAELLGRGIDVNPPDR